MNLEIGFQGAAKGAKNIFGNILPSVWIQWYKAPVLIAKLPDLVQTNQKRTQTDFLASFYEG